MTPALIDCHTHLVFGGDRSAEFEQRLEGASYEDIARAGGGIMSTVRATRAMTADELFAAALPRMQSLAAEGVATVEIKSGYGLDLDSEIKMLEVARRLGESSGINVQTTLLAAHTVPAEFQGKADDYIDLICNELLPEERLNQSDQFTYRASDGELQSDPATVHLTILPPNAPPEFISDAQPPSSAATRSTSGALQTGVETALFM